VRPGGESPAKGRGGDAEQAGDRGQLGLAVNANLDGAGGGGVAARGRVVDESDVAQQEDGGEHAHHVQEGDAQHAQTCLPRLEARSVLCLILVRVAMPQVIQVVDRVLF